MRFDARRRSFLLRTPFTSPQLRSGPSCSAQAPLTPGQAGTISFSMQIPSEAAGLGQLAIIVNASDQNNAFSWCANMTLTL